MFWRKSWPRHFQSYWSRTHFLSLPKIFSSKPPVQDISIITFPRSAEGVEVAEVSRFLVYTNVTVDKSAINSSGFISAGHFFTFFYTFILFLPSWRGRELLIVIIYLYIDFLNKFLSFLLVCFFSNYGK